MELHSRSSVRDSSFFFRVRRQADGQGPDDATLAGEQRFLYGCVAWAASWAALVLRCWAPSAPAAAAAASAQPHRCCPAVRRFVFCRQRQDESLRRGGEQNSVVVLSEQPFSAALLPLSQIAGPLYFNQVGWALTPLAVSRGLWLFGGPPGSQAGDDGTAAQAQLLAHRMRPAPQPLTPPAVTPRPAGRARAGAGAGRGAGLARARTQRAAAAARRHVHHTGAPACLPVLPAAGPGAAAGLAGARRPAAPPPLRSPSATPRHVHTSAPAPQRPSAPSQPPHPLSPTLHPPPSPQTPSSSGGYLNRRSSATAVSRTRSGESGSAKSSPHGSMVGLSHLASLAVSSPTRVASSEELAAGGSPVVVHTLSSERRALALPGPAPACSPAHRLPGPAAEPRAAPAQPGAARPLQAPTCCGTRSQRRRQCRCGRPAWTSAAAWPPAAPATTCPMTAVRRQVRHVVAAGGASAFLGHSQGPSRPRGRLSQQRGCPSGRPRRLRPHADARTCSPPQRARAAARRRPAAPRCAAPPLSSAPAALSTTTTKRSCTASSPRCGAWGLGAWLGPGGWEAAAWRALGPSGCWRGCRGAGRVRWPAAAAALRAEPRRGAGAAPRRGAGP
jgi:hypothetical protein